MGKQIPNNAAGRLLGILEEARQQSPNEPIKNVWAKVLGVELTDLPGLWVQLAELNELPRVIRAQMAALPSIDPTPYLREMGTIEAGLAWTNLDAPWTNVANRFTDGSMMLLGVCDEQLSRVATEPFVDVDEVAALHSEIRDLFDGAAGIEGLDPALREFVLGHLSDIDIALQRFRIQGAKPLHDALLRMAGDATLNGVPGSHESGDHPWIKKAWGVFFVASQLLSFANSAYSLEHNIYPSARPAIVAPHPADGVGQLPAPKSIPPPSDRTPN